MAETATDDTRRLLLRAGIALTLTPLAAAHSADWSSKRGNGLSGSTKGSPPVQATPHQGLLLSGMYSGRGAARRNWLSWTVSGSAQSAAGVQRLALPARAHGLCTVPGQPGRILLFARRPGDRMWEIDLNSATISRELRAGSGYHFYGHGVCSADGRYLFTSENRYQDGAGIIRVRDTNDFHLIDEMPSGGIGPHDLALLSDGCTLVVANGGIRTHPAQPRKKLNRDSMQPNLSYLDSGSGELLEQHRPAHHQLSIRHLALTADDQLVAVQQFEGRRGHVLPLVLLHRRGEQPRTPHMDGQVLLRMNHYTASVAVDAGGDTALVTSPKGNLITLWDLRRDRLLASYDLQRPYGVAFDSASNHFTVTCGQGAVIALTVGKQPIQLSPDAIPGTATTANGWHHGKWDNHLIWTEINRGEQHYAA